MKLWLLKQDVNNDYDTYDSAVVAAETAEEATRWHPKGDKLESGWSLDPAKHWYEAWANSQDQVKAELIGEAAPGVAEGVVLASFNAG